MDYVSKLREKLDNAKVDNHAGDSDYIRIKEKMDLLVPSLNKKTEVFYNIFCTLDVDYFSQFWNFRSVNFNFN